MSSRRDEYLHTVRRLAAARCTAVTAVGELRSRLPLVEVPHELPEAWRTSAMVEELCAAATDSVALARLATRVAAAIDDSWPRVLRAQAAARAGCALAEASRAAGDPDAALHALEQARTALAPEPALVEERATADLIEGRTLLHLGATERARTLLLSALSTFHALGSADLLAETTAALASLTSAETPPASGAG